MRRNTVFIALLLACGLALPVIKVKAQTELPEMIVSPYFSGYFKYGEWLPIEIEIENPGNDIDAEVQIRVPKNNGGVTFSAPVSLPSGAHKRITLNVLPNNYSHSLEVNLIQDGEVLVTKKVEVHPLMNINVMIGLLSSERQALSLIQGVQYPNNMRPVEVVDITREDIPERYEGLRSFDVLVFNDIDTSDLSPEQVNALRNWIYDGGRLVLGGGAGARRTFAGLPQDLLPGEIVGEVKLGAGDLSVLSDYADGESIDMDGNFVCTQIESSGYSLAETEDIILVSESKNGSGYIDFVALDLSSPPLDGWAGTVEFWEKLLRSREDQYNLPSDMSQRSMRASNMTYSLSNIPTMELPSLKWLAIILAVYIVIIGPVNYYILKKKNRLHLAWATIPGITLVFSAATFGSGYLMRGSDVIIHKIGIAELLTEDTANLTTYMGLFSPSQTSYQVEVSSDGLLSPMQDDSYAYMGGSYSGETTLVQGDPIILKGLSVDQWSMQSFMAEQTWQGMGTISGDLVLKEGKLTGSVRNETDQVLHDVAVVIKNGYQRVGDIEPGQEVDVEIDLTAQPENRYQSVFYRMYMDSETGMMDSNPESELKRSVLSQIFENDMVYRATSSILKPMAVAGPLDYAQIFSEVLVLGWLDQVPPEVTISSNIPTIYSTGLVYTYLDFELPRSGPVAIPPGIIQGNVVDTNAGFCGGMESVSLYMDRDTMAQIEYSLPAVEYYDYSELDLHITLDVPTDTQFLDLSLFDWQKEQWIPFKDEVSGVNIVRSPERFIADNGTVQVQLSHTGNNPSGGCIYFDMGFIAEGKGE